MNKLEQTRKKGGRTLIAISIIGIAVYLGFTPLFEKIQGGVAGNVVGASFGAIFAFQILPTIVFFSALTSVLFYLGVLQKIVYFFAVIMKKIN